MSKWKTGCFKDMNGIIDNLKQQTSEIKVEHKK